MASIAEINDRFRKAVFLKPQRNGRLLLTPGVVDMPDKQLKSVATAIINYTDFDGDNDPYQEHDFGAVDIHGTPKVFWKIDYYSSPACEYGTDNPADPKTYRVLTVMLASEY